MANHDHYDYKTEAECLNKLFEGVNRAAFSRKYKVPGGASMINQHLKGVRPISLEAAICYVKGFQCPISEISPRLAGLIQEAMIFNSPPPMEIKTQVNSINAAISLIAKIFEKADSVSRKQLRPIIDEMLDNPSNFEKLTKIFEATLEMHKSLADSHPKEAPTRKQHDEFARVAVNN